VLNINIVAEVLVRHVQSGGVSWEESLRLSVPQRIAVKGGRKSKRRKRPTRDADADGEGNEEAGRQLQRGRPDEGVEG
jgi:hypothetical protein